MQISVAQLTSPHSLNSSSISSDHSSMFSGKGLGVSYCMYSNWGYEKKTRIWTNKEEFNNKICDKSGACGNMIDKQHNKVLGNGYEMIDGKKVLCNTKALRKKHKINVSKEIHTVGEKKAKVNYNNETDKLDRYRIPEDLIYSLFLE
jgi:hypothetical protein